MDRRTDGKKEKFELVFWARCHLAHPAQSRNSQGPLATGRDRARLGVNWCQVFRGNYQIAIVSARKIVFSFPACCCHGNFYNRNCLLRRTAGKVDLRCFVVILEVSA